MSFLVHFTEKTQLGTYIAKVWLYKKNVTDFLEQEKSPKISKFFLSGEKPLIASKKMCTLLNVTKKLLRIKKALFYIIKKFTRKLSIA